MIQISDNLYVRLYNHLKLRSTTYPVASKRDAFSSLRRECKELLTMLEAYGDQQIDKGENNDHQQRNF